MDPLPRYSSEPAEGTPISVGALLRREGRGRHALDRPLVPRGHSRPAPAPLAPSRHGVRKATAAAGALFAAGAVFGGAVLEEALLTPDVGGPTPGVDGAGDPTFAQPGTAPPDPPPGSARLLLATDTSDLGSDDPLPRVSGADLGRDALAAAIGGPGPNAAPSRAPLPRNDPTSSAGPRSAGTVPGGPAPGEPAPGGPAAGAPIADAPTAGGPPSGGPTAGGPTAGGPEPGGAGPDRPAPANPTPSGPGPDDLDPDRLSPNPPAPVAPGPGIRTLPDLGTPPVAVPGVTVPGTPVSTPTVALSAAVVDTPDLGLDVDGDGLVLAPSRTAVTTPDLEVDEVDAGPLAVSDTTAELPDIAVGADGDPPLLAVGDEPELTVPAVRISSATVVTPDVSLGGATVDLPDLETPEVGTPAVPVVATVGGLLGR